jgi:hypothetical protein
MPKEQKETRTTKTAITDKIKREICEYAQKYPKLSHSEIGTVFNLKNRSTITRILSKRDKWLSIDIGKGRFA